MGVDKHFSRLHSLSVKHKRAKKKLEAEDDERTSWFKDDLRIVGKDAKKKMKKLYRDKIKDIKLRKSVYPDRALVFYMAYPEYLFEAYDAIKKEVVRLPQEGTPEHLQVIEEDDNHVGVQLFVPHPESLVKLTPYSYSKRFSVPFAKVGKTYKAIKQLMKENGFLLTQSKKFNFCWGFSKHRKDVYVVQVYQGAPRLREVFPLLRLLAGRSEGLLVDEPE